MTHRQPARSQPLPSEEAEVLNSLTGYTLYARVRELYLTGWTLRSIGDALEPPRPRSTVRYWVNRPIPITSAAPLPVPTAPIPVQPRATGKRVRTYLTNAEIVEIRDLAPIARRYRASMSPAHPAAVANKDLSDLCLRHFTNKVSIGDLAVAAGVSYRAMARRIERA